MEIQTLQSIEAAEEANDRPALFSCLAAGPAAVRARAADTLLRLYAPGTRVRGGLARDFGREPAAVTQPLFDELSGVIGWQPTGEWKRFIASLDMGFDQWREGTGYDLAALSAMNAEERAMIRQWLRSRVSSALFQVDWRDLEAANALGDSELLESLRDHPHRETRLRVKDMLEDSGAVEQELCRSLQEATTLGELSRSLDRVPDHPTADVKQALIARLRQNDQWFVSTAMAMLEAFSQLDSWKERPFLFQVKEEGASGPLMKELLAKVGE